MQRLLVGMCLLWGCGGAPIQANHSHFDAIQRQETRMDVAGNVAFDAERPCPERVAAQGEARRASDRICEVAAPINDADATRRCHDSQARSAAIDASLGSCQH
ncbi:MAG: hypothetical protein AB8H86_18110 [Polyangiales bacterium]